MIPLIALECVISSAHAWGRQSFMECLKQSTGGNYGNESESDSQTEA